MTPKHEQHDADSQAMNESMMTRRHYKMLAMNLAISLGIMYFMMFTMIYSLGELYQNINFLYMALVMWAPMGSLMLLMMSGMYRNRRLNLALHAAFAVIFILSFVAIRQQGLVNDQQFLRSMIPHHSGAILMCEQASLSDPQLIELCSGIIKSQRDEIELMKAMLQDQRIPT